MKYVFLLLPFLMAATWPDMSIFHLDGLWKNHTGREMQLSELAGHPIIAAMVYTSCEHTCPMITSKIKGIRSKLPEKLQKSTKFVLISFDPEGDTPETLAKYKEKQKLDENWILLTSNDQEVRKVAGVLGVNYKKIPDGGFSHSNIIVLLDKNGVLVTKMERLNEDSGIVIEKIKQLNDN